MSRSLLQFFKDQGGNPAHDNLRLTWPGHVDGFPYVGDHIPNLTNDESESLSLRSNFHCFLFCLWDESHLTYFNWVQNYVANGLFFEKRRIDNWDEGKKHLRVWLEWVQVYSELPKKGMESDAESTIIPYNNPPQPISA